MQTGRAGRSTDGSGGWKYGRLVRVVVQTDQAGRRTEGLDG